MFRPVLHILKIGGKLIEQPQKLEEVLKVFHQLEGYKALVHGGGKRADDLLKQMRIKPQMYEGRRLTDEQTLDVVVMVYAGLLNKKIVGQLQALGCNALGLSGADGNIIKAHKRKVKDIDYGYAGDIDEVNAAAISQLLGAGFSPVFCAITHDGKGQLLNTNADTIASSIARAMTGHFSVSLKLCFEKDGVLANPEDDQSVISQIDRQAYTAYRKEGTVSEGMIPKMDNAFEALSEGVIEVIIGSPKSIGEGKATRLV